MELPDELELLELDEARPELEEELLELEVLEEEELDEELEEELVELELGFVPEELDEEPELLDELEAVGSPSAPQPDSPATQRVSAIIFFVAIDLFAVIHAPN